jgi:outer membrane murein-binding lipoprotein Lpp
MRRCCQPHVQVRRSLAESSESRMVAKSDPKLTAVQKTAQRLARAEMQLEAAREAFYAAVRDARAAGLSISAIARARGVSRQAIQKLFDRLDR